jgi:hypothetical protein
MPRPLAIEQSTPPPRAGVLAKQRVTLGVIDGGDTPVFEDRDWEDKLLASAIGDLETLTTAGGAR